MVQNIYKNITFVLIKYYYNYVEQKTVKIFTWHQYNEIHSNNINLLIWNDRDLFSYSYYNSMYRHKYIFTWKLIFFY